MTNNPDFVSLSDSEVPTIILQSRHSLDPIRSVTEFSVTVTLDSNPSITVTGTFTAELGCAED